MKLLTIDSNVFVSSFIINDQFHKRSTEFFSRLSSHETLIIIPSLVVCEVLHILRRIAGSEVDKLQAVYSAFQDTKRFSLIPNDKPFVEQFFTLPFKGGLRTSDAIVVTVAVIYKTTLISWDRQLLKGARCLVAACGTPTDIF